MSEKTVKAAPEVKTEAKAPVKTAAKTAVKAETKAPAKTAVKTETKAAVKVPVKAAAKTEAKTEAKAPAKPETKTAVKTETRVAVKAPVTAVKTLKVTYVKSAIGFNKKQIKIIQALGLGKLNSSNILPDNASVRGSIFHVKHLVKVEEIN